VAPPDSVFLESRVTPDGDLARLLDGIDPFAFGRDDDLRLSRTELERAAFAALDLDGDRRLTRDEMSCYPRHLRYRDAAADAQWRALDSTRDGSLDAREFDLLDEEWQVVDVDVDGSCRLPYDLGYWERRLQGGPVAPEWPRRRGRTYPLPPGLTLERLLAVLDRDGDGALTTRELKRRRDLLPPIDTDTSAILEPDELERALGQLARTAVDAGPDGFEARWDLDGDGKVEEAELPVPAGQRARLSRD
jgi:Ca2+-binding EF-hand superfamily protein